MKLISSSDAAALLRDGWTVSTSGFTGSGHPEGVTTAIERRFLETGAPDLKTMDARIFTDAPMFAART